MHIFGDRIWPLILTGQWTAEKYNFTVAENRRKAGGFEIVVLEDKYGNGTLDEATVAAEKAISRVFAERMKDPDFRHLAEMPSVGEIEEQERKG